MSDAPVYMIANFTVHDAGTYRKYEKGFFPILKKHGGSFHTFDDSSETLEGDDERSGRIVIFQFPNESAARAWWAARDQQPRTQPGGSLQLASRDLRIVHPAADRAQAPPPATPLPRSQRPPQRARQPLAALAQARAELGASIEAENLLDRARSMLTTLPNDDETARIRQEVESVRLTLANGL